MLDLCRGGDFRKSAMAENRRDEQMFLSSVYKILENQLLKGPQKVMPGPVGAGSCASGSDWEPGLSVGLEGP